VRYYSFVNTFSILDRLQELKAAQMAAMKTAQEEKEAMQKELTLK